LASNAGLTFHVPEPPTRPGDAPDFSGLDIPAAGIVARPDCFSPEPELRALPYTLIRVLDDEGNAVGEWDPQLPPETLRKALRGMMLTRQFDDRLFRIHRQGKTSFYLKSTGEEAISVAQSMMLGAGDMSFPTYRMLGWLMARDYPLIDLVNQIFSNAKDPLRGRQLPILYSARDYGFYSVSGNLGSRFGAAVGWAMASAYKGDDKIALGVVGDGTTAEGDFHEALTFAAVYRAPVILCVTNNQWAISSYSGIAGSELTTFAAKSIAYGLPGLRVDGNDLLAVWAATDWAARRARANHGATLIELFTYRASGHSTSDDPTRYRPADEPTAWPLGDPVERLKQHLIVIGEWDEDRHTALIEELEQAIRAALKEGEAVGSLGKSKPPLEEMFEDVFEEPDWRVIEQRREAMGE
jgi:2-oxoisovalerate dehydrogenase E1 component alpha subunit